MSAIIEEPITKDVLIPGVPLELYLRAIRLKEQLRCDNWREFLLMAVDCLEGDRSG